MENKSTPNETTPKTEPARPIRASGGDYIVVQGNVGAGASLGRGSVTIDQLAGRDMMINNGMLASSPDQFQLLLEALRDMVEAAHESGELDDPTAKNVIEELNTVADMASQPQPPKKRLLDKLRSLTEMLDSTSDLLSSGGRVVKILIKAVPIASLLVKLADHLF